MIAALLAALAGHAAHAAALSWRIDEGAHPKLGPIRFAALRDAVVTPLGNARVHSLLFFSCERNSSTIAIELANASARDDPGGLKPKAMPRLLCDGAREIAARWQVNELGDALARGLSPSRIRACRTVRVVQEVLLPAGGAARVDFTIEPPAAELASVLYTCGAEASAAAVALAAPAAAPTAPPAPAAPAAAGWKSARTVAAGRTNLRARPAIDAAVVAQLPPDVAVLVQPASGDWYHVKSPGRAKFEGYIRQDRLVFR